MQRRPFLAGLGAVACAAIAGCLDFVDDTGESDDEDQSDEEGRSTDTDDLDEETIELADRMGSTLEEELSFRDWRFHGELFIPEFTTEAGPEEEIPILARAFADIVADGFEYESMPTAFDDGIIDYMVYIQPEWAAEYNAGERTEEEYVEDIEATIH